MFSKFLPTDHFLVKGKSGNCSGNSRQLLDREFKMGIDSGSGEALGAFIFDNLRITVMCCTSGDTPDKPKETFYKIAFC